HVLPRERRFPRTPAHFLQRERHFPRTLTHILRRERHVLRTLAHILGRSAAERRQTVAPRRQPGVWTSSLPIEPRSGGRTRTAQSVRPTGWRAASRLRRGSRGWLRRGGRRFLRSRRGRRRRDGPLRPRPAPPGRR